MPAMPTSRLVLVGYRACGKTTVGRLLAARLSCPFLDADHELERTLGMSIAAFFGVQGEAAFRDRESAALASLLAQPGPWVLSTGGGVVLRPGNRATLAASGTRVVYLHAPADVLQGRLAADAGGRPSLTGAGVVIEVPRLLAERDPWYRAVASTVVDARQSPAAVVAELLRLVAHA